MKLMRFRFTKLSALLFLGFLNKGHAALDPYPFIPEGESNGAPRTVNNYFPEREGRNERAVLLGLTASENPDVTIKAFQLRNGISSDVVVTDKPKQFNPFPQKRISQSFGPDLKGITVAFHLKGTQYSENGEPKGWLVARDVADKMKEALLDLKEEGTFPNLTFVSSHQILRNSKWEGNIVNLHEEQSVNGVVYPSLSELLNLRVLTRDMLEKCKGTIEGKERNIACNILQLAHKTRTK